MQENNSIIFLKGNLPRFFVMQSEYVKLWLHAEKIKIE